MIPQTDPSWLVARVGKLTASRMADAMAMIKDGPKLKDGTQKMKPGADRFNLLRDLLAERLEGAAVDHFVSDAMKNGILYEPEAANAYEAHTGNLAMPGGLVDHPEIEFFAATPDRFIGRDGLVEIKCPTSRTFVAWVTEGVIPEQHKPQMLSQLAFTRRKWVDFVAYNPQNPPQYRLFIRRFTPTPEQIAAVEKVAIDFLAELDLMFDLFTRNIANAPTDTARPDPVAASAEAQEHMDVSA